MFELWEVNNSAFSDSLKRQDAAACVTFFDRAYLCLKGLLLLLFVVVVVVVVVVDAGSFSLHVPILSTHYCWLIVDCSRC